MLLLFLTTLSATVSTAPVLVWHFHQFSPAGLVTNLVAIPLIAWGAVPTGLFGLATLPVFPALAHGILTLSAGLIYLTIELAKIISRFPVLQAVPVYLTTSDLVLLCGILLCFLPLKDLKYRWQMRLATILMTLTAVYLLMPQKTAFQITAFGVGQGDATLISISADTHFLVDGGGLPRSSIDPGEDLIAPALGRMGIKQLEGIIATHSHPDHSSGLSFIAKRFPTKKFYYAGNLNSYSDELQATLEKHNVSTVQVPEGWTEIFAERTKRVSLFVPNQKSRNINERSIITYTSNSDTGVLLTADAGSPALQQLKEAGLSGQISLLKLPHHGSRHAEPDILLKWLKPAISFVSAGRGNSYGFPHEEVITACHENHSQLYRTDQEGMIKFIYSMGRWQITSDKIEDARLISIRKEAL
jgi:competence protein ComEC